MTGLLRCTVFLVVAAITMRATDGRAASVESSKSPKLARSTRAITARDQPASTEQLIEQLGSDQYFLRRQAEEELVERGAHAFDSLQQAEHHPDLEIAATAHYILQQIRIEWAHPDDSADVRSIMHRYGELSKQERLEKMDQLADLADDEGLAALCRIARFESSPKVARYAALKVLLTKSPPGRTTAATATITTEIGDSQRTPAQWLRAYAEQLARPDRVLSRWLKLIDDEIALIDDDSADTEAAYAIELIDFQLDLCRGKKQPDAVFAGLKRRTDLYTKTSGRLRDGLIFAMNWLWENEEWDALYLLEDHYADAIRDQRVLIYFSAASRWKQGRDELAEEFAERAFALEADDAKERAAIGDVIGEMGRHDWAEREWWYVVEKFPVLDVNSLSARRSLTSFRLHDRGEDKRAAQLMADICDAVEAEANVNGGAIPDAGRRKWFRQFHAQREYFLACQAATDGNFPEQRRHLDAAYGFDPEDADVLIAMYRSPGADEAYHRTSVDRVQGAANKVAAKIEQDPDNSQWYNHWAWLISNTEGDYAQAVKYSLRSLELAPDNPSYLDTLGSCYHAVDDLENAVKVEREAVRRHPHMQVMRDQLQLFESALAERQKK